MWKGKTSESRENSLGVRKIKCSAEQLMYQETPDLLNV